MLKISFSFKAVKTKFKKEKKITNKTPKPKNQILDKQVTGIIVSEHDYRINDINANIEFSVCIDNNSNIVPIDKSCYSCKTKRKVYRLTKEGFIVYIRNGEGILPELPFCFYPFKVGLNVEGDVIKDKNNNITFKIKRIIQ